MCPGNTRANGAQNPHYTTTFAFTNDFPALVPASAAGKKYAGFGAAGPAQGRNHASHDQQSFGAFDTIDSLLVAQPEAGICRVVCFSPRHDITLAKMSRDDIRRVVDLWASERTALATRNEVSYVQIFENRGAMMGASNPHPHGQIWGSATVPTEVTKEDARQRAHLERFGRDLLGDYLDLELAAEARIVCKNTAFIALVPFWAIWPFETMILPRRLVAAIDELTEDERNALADILKRVLRRCDNLFDAPCPYSMGFHECPADGEPHLAWRWHAHIYPPVLRSATVRKFMVGYEMLASAQRDIPPEEAAERLRATTEE